MQLLLAQLFSGNEVESSSTVTKEKPIVMRASNRFRFSVHSPVALDLYDIVGAHTGLVPNSNATSDLMFVEEDISNSYYMEFGEGKYTGADATASTTARLTGTGYGTFTFKVENVVGDIIATTTTFADIPVVPGARATFATVDGTVNAPLVIDMDADGIVDVEVRAGEGLTIGELIGLLRGTVRTFGLSEKERAKIVRALDKFERVLQKDYKGSLETKKSELAFKNFGTLITKFQKRGLLENDEALQLFHILARMDG